MEYACSFPLIDSGRANDVELKYNIALLDHLFRILCTIKMTDDVTNQIQYKKYGLYLLTFTIQNQIVTWSCQSSDVIVTSISIIGRIDRRDVGDEDRVDPDLLDRAVRLLQLQNLDRIYSYHTRPRYDRCPFIDKRTSLVVA